MSVKLLLMIAGAGAVGTLLRYLLNLAFLRRGSWEFPWATLTINVLGCFAAGVLYALFAGKLERFSGFAPVVMIGFLGAFTTLSTFALESFILAQGGQLWRAVLNIGVQNILGLSAVCFGYYLVKTIGFST